jgi:hypothetical protein
VADAAAARPDADHEHHKGREDHED